MLKQYKYQYNHYQAMTGWRGSLNAYVKWRNVHNLQAMQALDLCK